MISIYLNINFSITMFKLIYVICFFLNCFRDLLCGVMCGVIVFSRVEYG